MAKFETVHESIKKFGKNSYISYAVRELVEEHGARNRFVVITRGFITREGELRWTKFTTLPYEPELLGWLASELDLTRAYAEPRPTKATPQE